MAEVDGRKPDTREDEDPETPGDPDVVMYCGPCGNLEASSFCKDCHEYLCPGCTRCHKRLGVTKHHTLLQGPQLPPSHPTRENPATENFTKCADHPQEEIKLFCPTHNDLCCVACMAHVTCTKDYIPDIAKEFKTGPEYTELLSDIHDLDVTGVQCQADIDRCLQEVDTMSFHEIDKLKKYKAAIIEYLEKREKELIADVQRLRDRDTSLLHELQGRLRTWQSDLNNVKTQLQSHENSSNQLFIATKRMRKLVRELQTVLQDMQQQTKYQRYTLLNDPRMEKMLLDNTGFATVDELFGTFFWQSHTIKSYNIRMRTVDLQTRTNVVR